MLEFHCVLEIGALSGIVSGLIITCYVWMRDAAAKKK
jgi:hypothetical protein